MCVWGGAFGVMLGSVMLTRTHLYADVHNSTAVAHYRPRLTERTRLAQLFPTLPSTSRLQRQKQLALPWSRAVSIKNTIPPAFKCYLRRALRYQRIHGWYSSIYAQVCASSNNVLWHNTLHFRRPFKPLRHRRLLRFESSRSRNDRICNDKHVSLRCKCWPMRCDPHLTHLLLF